MLGSLLAGAAAVQPVPFEQHRVECAGKQGWSDPAPPIRIFANIYDVGTCGVAVLLIAASYLIGQLTAGQDVKIIKDLGLAATAVFGLFIAIFTCMILMRFGL